MGNMRQVIFDSLPMLITNLEKLLLIVPRKLIVMVHWLIPYSYGAVNPI